MLPEQPATPEYLTILRDIRNLLAGQSAELVSREGLAEMLSISLRSIDLLSATPGGLPAPIFIGTRKLWRKKEILIWISGGCKSVPSKSR